MTIYEDEFDLYPYVVTLLNSWKLIVFLAGIAAAAALVFSLLQPRTYTATSTIIGTYRRPVLTLSDEFSTISDTGDARNKHQAFLTIANSDKIALTVYEMVSDELPDDMALGDFKNQVEISDQGDAIIITASFEDPLLSVEVANLWANETVTAINTIYGDVQPLAPIQAQIVDARDTYLASQAELETFIEENQMAALERNISEAQQVLNILQTAQLGIIDSHLSTQLDLITQQADQYFNALTDQNQIVFSKQVEEQFNRLSFYSTRRTELEALLVQAQALKEQLEAGNRSVPGDTGDSLALFLTWAKLFGMDDGNLDITLTELTGLQDEKLNYVADITGMIGQIDTELEKTDSKLQELSILLASGGDYQYYEIPDADNPLFEAGMEKLDSLLMLDLPSPLTPNFEGTVLANQIDQISSGIQTLQAQLENEQAKQRGLINERDLAEQAYQVLLVKETEIKAGSQTSNEVALAGPAVVPTKPDARGTITNTLLAGIVGGMLAVVWVFISTWWKNQPDDSAGATAQN